MKTLSRNLPALPKVIAPWWAWFILLAALGWFGYFLYKAPYIGGSLVLIGMFLHFKDQKKMKRLVAARPDDTICTFAKDLNPRDVDPWIIRATYDEFTSLLKLREIKFPIRASDRFKEDLNLDFDDLEEAIVVIAKRTCRSITETKSNPYYDHIKTVRDFVMFINHQPKYAEPSDAANA
jgi:hypothetical protein